jgi:uncharacterized protein YbjT (DUF2867 family)
MRVLLTGATGYIGRRLKVKFLQDDNIDLRVLVRNKKSITSDGIDVIEGDTFNLDSLRKALDGVDIAYYLIHSLRSKEYKNLDKKSAQNFLDIAKEMGVKRIVYLGGLGEKDKASLHLLSRIETGEILSSSKEVQTLWFRAGVIIGSGSASFEIIRNLVEKLPIMITPKWVDTDAEPIGVDDVIEYLYQSKDIYLEKSTVVDIGSGVLKYRDIMLKCAKVLKLKRYILPTKFLTISLSSHWLNLFTPVPINVSTALIEGLSSPVVKQNQNAKLIFPNIFPKNFETSVRQALNEIEQNQIISRWSDSSDVWERNHSKDISNAIFLDRQIESIEGIDKESVYKAFTSIGGKNGWFDFDFLWEIRGAIDKLLGGVGLNRGRRSECDLRTGDCLDFWRVVDINENRLLLFAQMKLPGKAWLEFRIDDKELIQSAYFYPKGIWGRLYWYLLVPMHFFVFKNLIKSIIKKARDIQSV